MKSQEKIMRQPEIEISSSGKGEIKLCFNRIPGSMLTRHTGSMAFHGAQKRGSSSIMDTQGRAWEAGNPHAHPHNRELVRPRDLQNPWTEAAAVIREAVSSGATPMAAPRSGRGRQMPWSQQRCCPGTCQGTVIACFPPGPHLD